VVTVYKYSLLDSVVKYQDSYLDGGDRGQFEMVSLRHEDSYKAWADQEYLKETLLRNVLSFPTHLQMGL
jgi:hypothetical protein